MARVGLSVPAGVAVLVLMTALALVGYRNMPPDPPYVTVERYGYTSIEVAREILPAWAFGVAGLVAWYRRPRNRVGPLMVLIGVAILVKGLQAVPVPALVSLGIWGSIGASLPAVLLGILVLVYPSGHFSTRADRWWAGVAVLYLLTIQVAWTLFSPTTRDSTLCDECRPLFILGYDEYVRLNLRNLSVIIFVGLLVALVILIARRWVRASAPARRVLAPVWLAGALVAGAGLTSTLVQHSIRWESVFHEYIAVPSLSAFLATRIPLNIQGYLPWIVATSLLLVPAALLWGVFRAHLAQSVVSALAIELQRTRGHSALIDRLRRALGDRSLELALWSRPAKTYVTPEGLPATLPNDEGARRVTRLDGNDGPLAALIHDPVLSDQRSLIDGVAAVAQLAIENERLHAEVKAQLEEVRGSRKRIVEAADEERRRVERNLHDGAQQRLVSLSLALSMAHEKASVDASPEVAMTLGEARSELREAIAELRELARGIHPAILTEAGLGPALGSLAEHSPVPVVVDVRLNQRLPDVVEATAYFVAAEALTNVAKHASASSATLSATLADGWLRLTVVDDGAGGAAPERGTGLRGLVDRVTSIGGRLSVADDMPGTRLEVEIPCSST
jgi:signal transduction histidine kinase